MCSGPKQKRLLSNDFSNISKSSLTEAYLAKVQLDKAKQQLISKGKYKGIIESKSLDDLNHHR